MRGWARPLSIALICREHETKQCKKARKCLRATSQGAPSTLHSPSTRSSVPRGVRGQTPLARFLFGNPARLLRRATRGDSSCARSCAILRSSHATVAVAGHRALGTCSVGLGTCSVTRHHGRGSGQHGTSPALEQSPDFHRACPMWPVSALPTRTHRAALPTTPCIRAACDWVVHPTAESAEIDVFWGAHRRVRPARRMLARVSGGARIKRDRRRLGEAASVDLIRSSVTPACRRSCRKSSAHPRARSRALRPP